MMVLCPAREQIHAQLVDVYYDERGAHEQSSCWSVSSIM